MKNIRHLLYSLSLVLLALSCVEDKIPSFAQLADIPCVLKADRSEIPFSAQGESKQLVIKSQNVSWELTGVPSWLTLSQKSGNGEAIVTLTAAENKGVDNTRVAVLQLRSTTAKYEFSKSVTITQSAASICLTTSETSLTLAPQAVQKNITINSNVEWEAVCSAEWLGLTKTNATTLSLNASENTTAGTRTATVTLRRVGTTRALATISVVQSEAGITGSTETVTFDVDGGTKSVDIEADVAWHATTSAASWLSVTPTGGAGGKVSLGISALANNSAAARSAYVYVKIGTEQKLAIPVSQEGISFNVVGTLENFAADGSTKQKLTVESNTAWAVLSCPEWLTVTPAQGSKGTTEITLQAAANNSLDSRSATLRIGIEGLTIYPDITVAQEGVTIDLGDRSLDFGWESAEREVEITFPGSWSAMASDDWLSLSRSSGLGEETIVVTAAANPGEDARTGTITVASEGRSMKITAVQQGQYLKINSTAGEVGAMGGSISLAVTTSVGAAASVEYQGTAKDWVTYDNDDKGNYTLSVAYNPSINSRTAQFVIKPTMSGTNTTCSSGVKFAITQKGRSLSANVSKIALSVAGGTSGTYTITADGGYAITKPEADDWYTLQQDSASCTFSIVATESTTGENRTSQITVSLTGLPSGETKDLVIGVLQYDLYNGHDAVDLGLPSGVKWATCNVGATKPEEYGGYFAWGETEEKEDYSLQTYIWCNGSYDSLTKYCTDSYRGTVDNKTVLEPEDDVAHVKWGGGWRMPTKTEFEELLNKCDWAWTTQNGVNGCMVTSRTNGNSIFLPAAGLRGGVTGGDMGVTGLYWSSWLGSRESMGSDDLNFTKNKQEFTSHYRHIGLPVRPVCGEPAVPVERYAVYVVSAGNGNVDLEYHNSTSAEFEAGATVTVYATPDEGYTFEGWYAKGNETPVSTDAEYTFTVSGDVVLEARFEKAEINGHGYVDLGLPSGVKWATCNVGATKPEEYGGYYAWGETEEKEDYSLQTYIWCNGSYDSLTKYCTDSYYGTVDNKTVLDPEDDVAHVKWGGSWRMPTKAELNELRNNCTCTWTTQNGINGYKVTSKTNGNSIFLPAAGTRYGAELLGSGNCGACWSSSLDGSGSHYACGLYFSSGNDGIYDYRYYGFSVRPVCGGDVASIVKYTLSVSSAGNGSVAINAISSTSATFEEGTSVAVVATPAEGYAFSGWYDGDALVSTDAEYTFTVSEDVALTAKFVLIVYEAVDLGLPSGVKWATFNVGASKPEECGGYYAWGETEEKENYDLSTYKWCKGSSYTMTKYCTNSSYGTVDNKTVLDPEDDVAHVKWGGSWRMPTRAEMNELRDNCTWSWTTLNSVNGYKVTSKTNGNSIFLPAAGDRNGSDLYDIGSDGYYWLNSLDEGNSHGAYLLYFYSGDYAWNRISRCCGHSVRPVCGGDVAPIVKYTVSVSSAGNGSVAINGISSTSATVEAGSTVTVVATPDAGCCFDGWFVEGSEEPVSTDAEYTFTVNEDIALVARFKIVDYNGQEYVDLGLPSGLKWATCNVGASSPEDCGDYYAWGETEVKDYYDWSTYKWCNGSYNTMTKYCTDSDYGTVDNKTVLDPEDDVAHVKWGGSWRMPTKTEQDELLSNCTLTWTTQNGVNGYKVTGPNGNTIFLPATGYYENSETIYGKGRDGGFWSNTLATDNNSRVYEMSFYTQSYFHSYKTSRYFGMTVRPVCSEPVAPVEKYIITVSSAGNGCVTIKDKEGTSAEFETGSTVTVVATPDEGYAFDGWYVDGNEEPVSTDAEYTFTVNEDIALVARFERIQQETNGYEAIDLGLSVKWATFNVGATKPEDFGGYYSWGETDKKRDYDWDIYKWCNGGEYTMTKYCNKSSYGTVDNKTTLDPEDDVAHVKWGGNWRMPTDEEVSELVENCEWSWTCVNNVYGYKVKGSNGNSIFLPAAGYYVDEEYRNAHENPSYSYYGFYWSNKLGNNNNYGLGLSFNKGYIEYAGYNDRKNGHCVRPVCCEPAAPVEKYTVTVNSAGNGNVAIKDKDGTSAEFEAGATVTVYATPDEGYTFEGWYANGNEPPVSTDAEYTFTVSEDVTLEARFEKAEINGHEYVDLGLPSGIKWATCNVGATSPEEYGGYYAWGELDEKNDYDWDTYKWCNGSETTLTKYCKESYYGTVDKKTTLDPEDDVAHVKWGGTWRMPTLEEQKELRNKCKWTWTTQNGVNGYKVTGPNGNSIFLPAAGLGLCGYYWSRSLNEGASIYACSLFFNSNYYALESLYRYRDFTVRPVSE